MNNQRIGALEALAEQLLNSCLSEGHIPYNAVTFPSGCRLAACPWCEMFDAIQRLPGVPIEVRIGKPEDWNYSEYGNRIETALLLWNNEHTDTKCQAMFGVGDADDIAEIMARLAERDPAEAEEFAANLARHRQETAFWGCRQ